MQELNLPIAFRTAYAHVLAILAFHFILVVLNYSICKNTFNNLSPTFGRDFCLYAFYNWFLIVDKIHFIPAVGSINLI
jgi:hypothetical protein